MVAGVDLGMRVHDCLAGDCAFGVEVYANAVGLAG